MVAKSDVTTKVKRRPRACINCHERKVKCTASETGVPCAKCVKRLTSASCVLVPPGIGSGALRVRRPPVEYVIPEEEYSITVASGGSHKIRATQHTSETFSLPDKSNIMDNHTFPQVLVQMSQQNIRATNEHRQETSQGPHVPGHLTVDTPLEQLGLTHDQRVVAEEDCQLETCLKMAQTSEITSEVLSTTSPQQARDVFTYHGGIDSTTIVGQTLSHKDSRKFVKVRIREPTKTSGDSINKLNDQALTYMQKMGSLATPATKICQQLVLLYFQRVYTYVPVLDRVAFMRQVSQGSCSSFLLHCVFTSVAPYISKELLDETGYSDRATAQKNFFAKAQLLYDLGVEKSQLCLLQGSLLLTGTNISFSVDKDCRFWLSNAVRIATQMGFHRKQILDQVNSELGKIIKRIFWVMYSREVIMMLGGRLNVPMLDDRFYDLPEVSESDWEDDAEAELVSLKLRPISALQKSYHVFSTRLSRICRQYMITFRSTAQSATLIAHSDVGEKLDYWWKSLPLELRAESADRWSSEYVWVLVLNALGHRVESMLHKSIRELQDCDEDAQRRSWQKQQSSMLELDSIFQRITLHDLVEFCPFSMTTCASTLIAMHMECALRPDCTHPRWCQSRISIHNGLAYLRSCVPLWDSVRWSLRMLEVVVENAGLSLTINGSPAVPLLRSQDHIQQSTLVETDVQHPNNMSSTEQDIMPSSEQQNMSTASTPFTVTDERHHGSHSVAASVDLREISFLFDQPLLDAIVGRNFDEMFMGDLLPFDLI